MKKIFAEPSLEVKKFSRVIATDPSTNVQQATAALVDGEGVAAVNVTVLTI